MRALYLFPLLFVIHCSAQAELYKWVDHNGKVSYSDMPPPQSVNNVETKPVTFDGDQTALPYTLTQAVKNMPITLYTQDNCQPCVDGKNFLIKNGIPFSEKVVTTNEEVKKLTQISGGPEVPVLFIGKHKVFGYNSSEWRTTLTQAGYPEANMLPVNYRHATPQPLIAAEPSAPPVVTHAETPARNPNGFQF